ncbi:MAG TPA: hypothetical protein VD905_06295 [Flavobacteriales bacterium]|nr:hypothetical protein [Flavobacteriales bacterium]
MKNLHDNLRANKEMIGVFSLVVKDKNGNVVESFEDRNLIVDKARYNMARLISAAGNNYYIDAIGFGVGTNEANVADLALTGSVEFAFDSIEYPDNNTVAFNWSLGENDANGMAITEFGLISNNGDLFARKVRAAINKTNDFTINGTWKIIF